MFPLSDGEVNIGVGTLATAAHPAQIRLRSPTSIYADVRLANPHLQLTALRASPRVGVAADGLLVPHVAGGKTWSIVRTPLAAAPAPPGTR